MGDYEKATPWSENGVKGCKRFLDRVWALQDMMNDEEDLSADLTGAFHRTLKKVSDDIEAMKFNTAIAAMMTLINQVYEKGSITRGEWKMLLSMLNPFAPHMTEELWEMAGFGGSLVTEAWPEYDEAKCVEATVEIVVQVNGKIKAHIDIPHDADQATVLSLAKAEEKVAAAIDGMTVVKELYVPAKLVNIVVRP
ncbi:MAG: class I tRNA ligase family protein, partial [Clostridia bacterium]|nr:class I tRNA ligase family protein [Clostridia bacterium]